MELTLFQRAVRTLREHHREHRRDAGSEDCIWCEFWLALARRDFKKLDELEQRQSDEVLEL